MKKKFKNEKYYQIYVENICWNFLQVKHQELTKRKESDTEELKNDTYVQMKRFNYDPQPQVYMYVFMYVDPETMAEEEYFPAATFF